MKFIRDKKRYFWLALLMLLFYIILGALVPFMTVKKVSKSFEEKFSLEDFYGKEEAESPPHLRSAKSSVDRAFLVETNKEAFDLRLAMIEEASEQIILTTFDIRDGESTMDIFASMIEAAERGVKIQIIVDGFSGTSHMSRNIIYEAAGVHPNIEIKFYNVPSLIKPWTLNGRMHDKYMIIDDKLLLMGGRNIFDYFIGDYPDKSVGYDREVLIYNTAFGTEKSGSSVISQVDDYFQEMWEDTTGKMVLNKRDIEHPEIVEAVTRLKEHYQENYNSKPELYTKAYDWEDITVPIKKATFISNPTHIFSKEPYVWYSLEQLMLNAKDRVVIHTPYAVFSKDMYEGIKKISEEVGDVTMLINSVAVGDNFVASSDYIHNKDKVLATGVQVYEYFGEHSSHGKSLVIDDDIAIIGSYNFDMRSTYLDTETMLVIHGEEFAEMLDEKLMGFKENSLAVDKHGNYVGDPAVVEVKVPFFKKVIFAFSSRLIQLARYLA